MTGWRNWFKRLAGGGAAALLALLLAAVIMVPEAKAVTDMQAALNQVVDWGVMRGDIAGNLNENNDITRAEFATMINRAFGYTRTGEIPFTDVANTDWYADDVSIAYQIGYMEGTSTTLFSPMASITREEAAVILARVLAMQPVVGVVEEHPKRIFRIQPPAGREIEYTPDAQAVLEHATQFHIGRHAPEAQHIIHVPPPGIAAFQPTGQRVIAHLRPVIVSLGR